MKMCEQILKNIAGEVLKYNPKKLNEKLLHLTSRAIEKWQVKSQTVPKLEN